MSMHATWQSLVGEWQGVTRLYLPDEPIRESASTASVTTVAQGKVCQLAYTWAYDGQPQDGQLLLSAQPDGSAQATYIDSWHMGDGMLTLAGRVAEDGQVDTLGSFSVDGDQAYGWRITIEPAADSLRIAMYFVEPDGGEETLGFEMVYTRGEAR